MSSMFLWAMAVSMVVWCKGFLDLYQAGLTDKIPHVIAVQSKQSNAIAQAWKTQEYHTVSATTPCRFHQCLFTGKRSYGCTVYS